MPKGPRQVPDVMRETSQLGAVMNWKAPRPPLSSSCEGTVAMQNSDSVLTDFVDILKKTP